MDIKFKSTTSDGHTDTWHCIATCYTRDLTRGIFFTKKKNKNKKF